MKRELIVVSWRQLGGGYLMFVDYDDLVSSRIVKDVLANTPRREWLAWWGQDYSARTDRLASSPCRRLSGTRSRRLAELAPEPAQRTTSVRAAESPAGIAGLARARLRAARTTGRPSWTARGEPIPLTTGLGAA
jgi:hypothetical protein